MATPAALVDLMHHQATVLRHDAVMSQQQVVTQIATLPCYVDAGKADTQPPAMTAYIGLTDAAPVRQGDYIELGGPTGEWPTMWLIGNVQTWWDQHGDYWCQQADLDAPAVSCEIENPNTTPDAEGRFQGWTTVLTMIGGIRPLTVSEQRRASQDGQVINLVMRFPQGLDGMITRSQRVKVISGGYTGTYEVLTIEHHPDAFTAMLRNYDPAGTPV